ncbi:MAG: oxidoreductase [Proteobacteria bacterium]|nr:acryloyl-CoA reductase [Pseudomonadota bacterium]NOG59045.1 oxidoreductase [Pseudomonadota bacterium]
MTEFQAFRVVKEDNQLIGRIESLTVDDLSQGDVLIKTAYSSVNYKDALAATGKGKIIRNFPCIAGIDVAGTVVESTDKRFKEGDSVLATGYDLGTGHDGGYSEYTRVPAEWVVFLPDSMSLFESMAIGTAGFTAALCVQRLEQNGQIPEMGPFVVTGATGGVGNFAIDIMSSLGYEVVAVTGKQESNQLLIDLGAEHILDRHNIKMDGPPMEKGEWGGAIDNVGGDILAWLTRTTKSWGNIASVGLAGGSQLNTTVMPFILRGVSILGITSSGCPTAYRQPLWERLATDLAPKHLDKIVTNTIDLEGLPDTFKKMLAGETTGRTVVEINPD